MDKNSPKPDLHRPTLGPEGCNAPWGRGYFKGFAAALLLSALGVDEATIEHDYLLTNLWYQPPASLAGQLPEDVRQVLWFVRPEFLHAALDTVRREHGSLARYLRGPVGLSEADLAALERRLLV